MATKYAEDIATIRTDQAVIKTDVKHILAHLNKLNATEARQWEQINENEGNIGILNTKVNAWATFQATLSLAVGGIASWLGINR